MSKEHDVSAIACQFQIEGEFAGATTHGSGHINDSYCVTFRQAGIPDRYILQRINHSIFKNPIALMENIQRVTSHLAAKVSCEPDRSRLALTLIPARDERAWHVDADGSYWRTYRFIENAHSFDAVQSTDQAFQAATRRSSGAAIARYHQRLPPYAETIRGIAASDRFRCCRSRNSGKTRD